MTLSRNSHPSGSSEDFETILIALAFAPENHQRYLFVAGQAARGKSKSRTGQPGRLFLLISVSSVSGVFKTLWMHFAAAFYVSALDNISLLK